MSYIGNTKIGKMYLGNTEIAKAYLGNDLVFQKTGGGEPPTPVDPGDISNYVQDGLVFHLDGINKGGTSGRWSSLVGTAYATLTSSVTSNDNNIQMNGNGTLTVTNGVSTLFASGTIEVCCEIPSSSSSMIIYYGLSNHLAFIVYGQSFFFGMGTSNNKWQVVPATKFTASANSVRFMQNGVAGGTLGSGSWTAGSTRLIGGRTSGSNRYYLNGKIYSIRIYNRQLTESEMLKNQKVDNARFNLGLNI